MARLPARDRRVLLGHGAHHWRHRTVLDPSADHARRGRGAAAGLYRLDLGAGPLCGAGGRADRLLLGLQRAGSHAAVAGVARRAPTVKGLALGFYNTSQAAGLFAGGALGGYLSSQVSSSAVYVLAAVLAVIWLIATWRLTPLPPRRTARQAAAS
ncbi:MFS transporter [Pigmentiphaga litoralis]|uniref:MFS transporter n=1 Tax=Pigmentiphaga litoralis TaxID=516702 RepID=UPI003B431265